MVEDVVDFKAQLQADSLREFEILVETGIKIPESGTAEGIAFRHIRREWREIGESKFIAKSSWMQSAKVNVIVPVRRVANPDGVMVDTASEIDGTIEDGT